MRSEGLWLVQENHAAVKLVSSVASRGMKTDSETRIELRNLHWNVKENVGQFKSVFVIRAAQCAAKLRCCLEHCRTCKSTLGKLAIVVNLEAIRFEFSTERSVSDGDNLCPLCSVILKSVWNSVGDTFELRYSWPWAEVSCTLLAAVPWNRLEHSHRKATLCVYLNLLILRRDVSHSRRQSVCQQLFWDWEKLNLLHELIP